MLTKNPWIKYPVQAPYVLPEDVELVRLNNLAYPQGHRYFIDLNLFAEPFVGNPNAGVYILNHNPGLGNNPNYAVMQNKNFLQIIRDNLTHTFGLYPFYIISSLLENLHPAGFTWWTRRLRGLIEEKNLKVIANNVFNLELGPYHSKNFRFINFPSLRYNRQLLLNAMHQKKPIVMLRSGSWNRLVPELDDYSNKIYLNSPQSAYISKGNVKKFEALVKVLPNV